MPSRHRKESFFDDIYELLVVLPWWGTPIVAACAYALLTWGVPWLFTLNAADDPMMQIPAQVIPKVSINAAPWVAGLVLFLGLLAAVERARKRRLLDAQTGADSIRQLSWQQFEQLLGEAFRREGYNVEECGGGGPDDGVDLCLRRGDKMILVQCKHWKDSKVGVKVVRELLGVVTSQLADGGILVTCGTFTTEAETFASRTSVKLIAGNELLQMIRQVQRTPRKAAPQPTTARVMSPAVAPVAAHATAKPYAVAAVSDPASLTTASLNPAHPSPPSCPKCGSTMVLRTARQGANAGSQFWGCSGYPKCRGVASRQSNTRASENGTTHYS